MDERHWDIEPIHLHCNREGRRGCYSMHQQHFHPEFLRVTYSIRQTNNQLPASPIFSHKCIKGRGGGPRQNGKWAGKRPVSLCWALRRDRCYFVSERLFFFLFHFIWSFVSFHLPPFPLTDNKQNGQLFLSEKNFVCVSRLLLLSLFFSLRILVEYNLLTRDGRQRFKRCFNLVLYSSAQSPLATLYILDI